MQNFNAKPKIYSIGSSSRDIKEFVSLLKGYGIKILIDVRRFPTSKFEHFKRENLSKFLNREGIEYVYLGRDLGGFREGGYQAYTKTRQYKEALNRLEDIAKAKPSCFMCAERLSAACHRRFIARSLSLRGWEVSEII
jgi:uncharacterized protein (DUF488 family)